MVSHNFMSSNVTLKPGLVGRSEGEGLMPFVSGHQHGPVSSMPQVLGTRYSRNATGTSMVAYTERMREISRARLELATNAPPESAQGAGLEVRARHISKWSGAPARGKKSELLNRRRPLSLEELPGRPGNKEEDKSAKQRRFSIPPELPSSTDTALSPRRDDRRVKISFVSASDLFDLVDFSLCSRRSRREAVKLAKMEDSLRFINDHLELFKISYGSHSGRPSTEQPRSHDSKADVSGLKVEGVASPRDATIQNGEGTTKQEQNERVMSEKNSHDVDEMLREKMISSRRHKLRHRPSRAKRMKLRGSGLGVIHEDEQHPAALESDRSARAPNLWDVTEAQTALPSPRSKRTSDVLVSEPQVTLPSSSHRKHAPDLLTSESKTVLPSPSQTERVTAVSISERKSNSLPTSLNGDRIQQGSALSERGSIFPSSSSLTAIKVSRVTEKRQPYRQDYDVNIHVPSGSLASFAFDMLQEGTPVKPTVSKLPAIPRNIGKASDSSADDRETEVALTQRNLAEHVNAPEDTKRQRNTPDARQTKANNAHTELPHARTRARAQKKFRRLIFLRDYPDQSYNNRYS